MKLYLKSFNLLLITLLLVFEISCKKDSKAPLIKTTPITNITSTTITSGGEVSAANANGITARGIQWSTEKNSYNDNNRTNNGSGSGPFTTTISGLKPFTTYYLMAYVIKDNVTIFGDQISAATSPDVPQLTIAACTKITSISYKFDCTKDYDGGSKITAYGICWSTKENPTLADNKTSNTAPGFNFNNTITLLGLATTYYIRAYATNGIGTGYSDQYILTTDSYLPTLTTDPVIGIQELTATCGGNITNDGGSPVLNRGVCWSTSPHPTINDYKTSDGSGIGVFISSVSGLLPYTDCLKANTTYFIRAYATNSYITGYGNELSFTTKPANATVTDIDGNIYHTLTIGTKVWLIENLKVTHYRNGDPISNVTDNTQWAGLTTGAFCWNNNDIKNKIPFGALYNYKATIDSRNICPVGYHIPSDAEWTLLLNYLGGSVAAYNKLIEAGRLNWVHFQGTGTNESGFTALPGGYRNQDGQFYPTGYIGFYYYSTPGIQLYNSNSFDFQSPNQIINSSHSIKYGLSVRCLKD